MSDSHLARSVSQIMYLVSGEILFFPRHKFASASLQTPIFDHRPSYFGVPPIFDTSKTTTPCKIWSGIRKNYLEVVIIPNNAKKYEKIDFQI